MTLQNGSCGECMITLSRSAASNLAIIWLFLCVRAAAVVLCLRFLIAILQSFLLQHCKRPYHKRSWCRELYRRMLLLFLKAFLPRLSATRLLCSCCYWCGSGQVTCPCIAWYWRDWKLHWWRTSQGIEAKVSR